MDKKTAIELLGGSVSSTAKEVGITYQAVADWPDQLTDRIADRVYAALARRNGGVLKVAAQDTQQAAGQGV